MAQRCGTGGVFAASPRLAPEARLAMSMMATITKQSMEGKGPLSFDQILSDPVNLNYFKNFCALPRVRVRVRVRVSPPRGAQLG